MFAHTYFIAAAALVMLNVPAIAQEEATKKPVTVQGAFAYPPIGAAKVGVAFMQLHNTSADDYTLQAASSEAFARIEMHTHLHEDGVMKMRKIDAIELPAGQTVALKSGGLHLMLFDAVTPIEAGSSVPIELTLAPKSGDGAAQKIRIDVPVQSRSSKSSEPAAQNGSAHHH